MRERADGARASRARRLRRTRPAGGCDDKGRGRAGGIHSTPDLRKADADWCWQGMAVLPCAELDVAEARAHCQRLRLCRHRPTWRACPRAGVGGGGGGGHPTTSRRKTSRSCSRISVRSRFLHQTCRPHSPWLWASSFTWRPLIVDVVAVEVAVVVAVACVFFARSCLSYACGRANLHVCVSEGGGGGGGRRGMPAGTCHSSKKRWARSVFLCSESIDTMTDRNRLSDRCSRALPARKSLR